MLKVRYAFFNPISFVTASFVHDDPSGLASNLLVFMLFAVLLYFINKSIGKLGFYFFSTCIMFVILPLMNYGALFYFGTYRIMEYGYGLSLVDSGLIGFTIPSLLLFSKFRLTTVNSAKLFISMVLFTGCFVVVPYAVISSYNLLILVLCTIGGILTGKHEFREILDYRRKNKLEALTVISLIIFYFLSIIGLFPSNIVTEKGIIDIMSHYIGLAFGILPFSFYVTHRDYSKPR